MNKNTFLWKSHLIAPFFAVQKTLHCDTATTTARKKKTFTDKANSTANIYETITDNNEKISITITTITEQKKLHQKLIKRRKRRVFSAVHSAGIVAVFIIVVAAAVAVVVVVVAVAVAVIFWCSTWKKVQAKLHWKNN